MNDVVPTDAPVETQDEMIARHDQEMSTLISESNAAMAVLENDSRELAEARRKLSSDIAALCDQQRAELNDAAPAQQAHA